MQYPIIDLITSAYINNGWTGLDIDYGINRFNYDVFRTASVRRGTAIYENNGVTLTAIERDAFTLSYGSDQIFWIPVNPGDIIRVGWKSEYDIRGSVYIFSEPGGITLATKESATVPQLITYTIPSNIYYISLRFGVSNAGDTIHYEDIMVTINEEMPTNYIPFHSPMTDLFSRLKLPLPHYFPHPVIDALQRAAAGTQTADDTEILRHYLTPLGIGGI